MILQILTNIIQIIKNFVNYKNVKNVKEINTDLNVKAIFQVLILHTKDYRKFLIIRHMVFSITSLAFGLTMICSTGLIKELLFYGCLFALFLTTLSLLDNLLKINIEK